MYVLSLLALVPIQVLTKEVENTPNGYPRLATFQVTE